jgi:hypothetical protein
VKVESLLSPEINLTNGSALALFLRDIPQNSSSKLMKGISPHGILWVDK